MGSTGSLWIRCLSMLKGGLFVIPIIQLTMIRYFHQT